MADRLLLYIDILGFSEMVQDKERLQEIYHIINRLNVFSHAPAFKTIVFSDTILVHSNFEGFEDQMARTIMWMCEFAQDLFYNLISRNVHFRAIIRRGDFEHQFMENIEAFYGQALVDAYNDERNFQCMGLFIQNDLAQYSDIFRTTPYDNKYHFVHICQHLGRISHSAEAYPLFGELILCEGTEWFYAYVIVYLRNLNQRMNDISLHPYVRAKYLGTWQMLLSRSRDLMQTLEKNNFDPRSIIDIDWSEPMRRVGTEDGYWG